MRRSLLVLSLVLLLTSAGCLNELTGRDDGANGSGDPAPAPPAALYLTGDKGLSTAAPHQATPARVATPDFYTTWALGEEQPTWTGAPLPRALVVTNATLTFFYTAEGGVATTGPQDQGFPEFVVYLGTEQAPMGWASVQGPDLVQEGEVVEVEASLALPKGGLVFPSNARPVVKIAPVQAQQDQGARLVVLVNGTDAPSRVNLTAHPVTLPAHQGRIVLRETNLVAGSAYALGQTEGATSRAYPVEVGDGTLGLVASLERTQGAGIADIDLEVLGPNGDVAARSVTPEDDEGLALYQPNVQAVGTGTWQVRVTNYGNVAAEFQLQVELLESR